MKKNKVVFKCVDLNGQEKEFAVIRPKVEDFNKAQFEYNKTFNSAIASQAMLSIEIDKYMRDRGLWNDKQEQEVEELRKKINVNSVKLAAGGIKKTDAKNLALEIRELRQRLTELLSEQSKLLSGSAEGQASNAKFQYLVYACLVYNDNGERVFKSYDEFCENLDTDLANEAAVKSTELLYDLDKIDRNKLPENKFLKQFNYIDDQLRLVNEDGKLIDAEGRLIDENGRFINENNEFVDIYGNRVDAEGNLLIEHQPFLDDDGNPILDQ